MLGGHLVEFAALTLVILSAAHTAIAAEVTLASMAPNSRRRAELLRVGFLGVRRTPRSGVGEANVLSSFGKEGI